MKRHRVCNWMINHAKGGCERTRKKKHYHSENNATHFFSIRLKKPTHPYLEFVNSGGDVAEYKQCPDELNNAEFVLHF